MMVKKTKTSGLAKALLKTAGDMRKAGLLDKATHDKITMRHLGGGGCAHGCTDNGRTNSGDARAKISQAVFARYLNLTVGYVS
jgi:putative transcriptional regulator